VKVDINEEKHKMITNFDNLMDVKKQHDTPPPLYANCDILVENGDIFESLVYHTISCL